MDTDTDTHSTEDEARRDAAWRIIETDAKEEAVRVLSLAWGRADVEKRELLRRYVDTFLRTRPQSFDRVAWIRDLDVAVISVPEKDVLDDALWGPACYPCVFAVDSRTNDYKLGAALIPGSFGSTYIVLLDPTTKTSLYYIFCLVLGAMNVCGQGATVFISLGTCDLDTQVKVARTFPVSRLCKYDDVYPALVKRLKIKMKPGFHPSSESTCALRKYLLRKRGVPAWVSYPHAHWFESELGTLAIVLDRQPRADHVIVVFRLWCEEAHPVLRAFLKSKARETLLLYLQSDGDTGPDLVRKSDILFRMREVKPHRPLREARLSVDAKEQLWRKAPVMTFEGSETIVHCLDAEMARQLFPDIYPATVDVDDVDGADAVFVALSKTYSHVLAYAIGARSKTATTIVKTSKRVINELWYAMFQFENLPLQIGAAVRTTVPNERDFERAVVCLSPTGVAFMRELPHTMYCGTDMRRCKKMRDATRVNLSQPKVVKNDQGVLNDRNCWKRLTGYVGMTPASRKNELLYGFSRHPNVLRLVVKPDAVDWSEIGVIVVTVLGDVQIRVWHKSIRVGHLYTVDDPNYKYITPPFNYHANDAWFKTLAALFPADKALFDRIDMKRRRLQEEARAAEEAMSMLSSSSSTSTVTVTPTKMQTLDKGTDFGDNLDLDTSLGEAFAGKDVLEILDDGDPFLPEPVLSFA
jgi:hypothetical protein